MEFKKYPETHFKNVEKLSKKEIKKEMEVILEGIEYHDYFYYVKNQPEISDAVYDKLFHRLKELETAFPDLRAAGVHLPKGR